MQFICLGIDMSSANTALRGVTRFGQETC